ncbi:hypothetical protein SLA2020_223460 [Shorea laevis]
MNTDGAASTNPGQAAARGVFRDHRDHWLMGYARNIGHANSLAAGLWIIREGLSFAVAKDFPKIIVETNSNVAVALLNSNCNSFHPLATLLDDCRAILRQLLQTLRLRWVSC